MVVSKHPRIGFILDLTIAVKTSMRPLFTKN